MAQYVYFTEEEKERANHVDLEEFLRCRGERLLPSGRDKRLASDHSITIRGNEWFDHEVREGGHSIRFVQLHYGLSYPEAVSLLLGGADHIPYPLAGERASEPRKPFALPPPFHDTRRALDYLVNERCIDRVILSEFIEKKMIYEEEMYHNAVFVGFDEHGAARHAHKRSTAGKRFCCNVTGSDPQYSFHLIGTDPQLFVFEAPIDLLSYITLYPQGWQAHSYVALCGTGEKAIQWLLKHTPDLREVFLCLDNDKAGLKAAERLSQKLQAGGYQRSILLPEHKDWNDDLKSLHQ